MIKKKLLIVTTSLLLLLIVACNNADQNASDQKNKNKEEPKTTATSINGRNTAYDILSNVNNGNNDNQDNNFNLGNLDDDLDFAQTPEREYIEHDLEDYNISADMTTISSNKYPHTKAILIQEAKFKDVKIDESKARQHGLSFKSQIKQRNVAAHFGDQGTATQKQAQQQTPKQGTSKRGQQNQNQATTEQSTPDQEKALPETETDSQQNTNQAQNQQEKDTDTQAEPKQQTQSGISAFESQVIELTNVERRKNGLSNLQADSSLSNVAREKSNDMQKNNYFSHTSPTYGSPFDMMRDFNISYKTAGENIAQGQPSPQEVVQAWMNSEGHRKNILSDKFTHIGVGYQQNGHHWTQMFIGK
jgi:uncharacterized YkwD family protein